MLDSGKKKFALCATKKINILTLVLSEKKILNETKNYNHLQYIVFRSSSGAGGKLDLIGSHMLC
jgi:hypothetical protein